MADAPDLPLSAIVERHNFSRCDTKTSHRRTIDLVPTGRDMQLPVGSLKLGFFATTVPVVIVALAGCQVQSQEGPGFDRPSTTGSALDDAESSASGSSAQLDHTTGHGDSGTPSDGSCATNEDCEGSPQGPYCDGGMCGGECIPGTTQPCYSGPADSKDVGACHGGTQTCMPSALWAPWCDGEVTPATSDCDANQVDDDCDGLVDDTDLDKDGYGGCQADCCDSPENCDGAELVNPGAFEVVGNDIDDDCDGTTDEVESTCDAGLSTASNDAMDYARAMDLCQTTSENPASPDDLVWGVIDSHFSLADGTGTPLDVQRSIRGNFGDIIRAQNGERMAVLSSGHAADRNDTNPPFAAFEPGQNLHTQSAAPADWLAANDGILPNPADCPAPWDLDAHDPIMLNLRVRVPTNARSFTVRMQFFSAEYPEWTCSTFNDFFVALVDSAATTNPADKNIAVYDDGTSSWPVGVNLVMVADGLFSQCQNGRVGCATDLDINYTGCLGTGLLDNTGFDDDDDACGGGQNQVGGGTGWLRMSGNVVPGEVMDIRLAIWDTSGHIYDSLVLLDDWQWSLEAASVGIIPG